MNFLKLFLPLLAFATPAAAATYTYESTAWTYLSYSIDLPAFRYEPLGIPTEDRITITIEADLAPSSTIQIDTSTVLASAGQYRSDAYGRGLFGEVTTDPAGKIVAWDFVLGQEADFALLFRSSNLGDAVDTLFYKYEFQCCDINESLFGQEILDARARNGNWTVVNEVTLPGGALLLLTGLLFVGGNAFRHRLKDA